jgi:hypothetical protein
MTPPTYDFLINSEVFVDDVAVAEKVFIDALGFPEPRDSWSNKAPGYGFTWLFHRVNPSLKVSPTRVEAMALAPIDPKIDPATTMRCLPLILAAQGDRPWKTHANELATRDFDEITTRLDDHGCRYFRMPGPGEYTRLWIGWTKDEPGAYRPDVDGGLIVEICHTATIAPRQDFWEVEPDPVVPPGALVRVLRRSWIVVDLQVSLRALEQNLGLIPASGPQFDEYLGAERAVLRFAHPNSAELELLQPVSAGELMESLDTWGPGSWAIRILTNDVDAKAEDLRRRGTAFDWRVDPRSGNALRVDTGTFGVPGIFEFAER